MKEKKQIKISLRLAILLVIIFLITIAINIVLFLALHNKNNPKNDTIKSTTPEDYGDYKEVFIKGNSYYQRLSTNTWKGEYHQDYFKLDSLEKAETIVEVVSYTKYLDIIDSINSISDDKIQDNYSNKDCNYIILKDAGYNWEMELIDCLEDDNKIIIYGDEENTYPTLPVNATGYLIAIPTNMPEGTDIEYRECYTSSEIDNLRKYDNPDGSTDLMDEKPIIYLYPTEDTEVSVKLLKDEKLTCSYPRYKDSWRVLAQSNGNLKDLNTNRQLYSLYYESISDVEFKVEKEGFVVKGEDTIEFLEEKLAILGLTEKEAEEFIVYWLPRLESNKYNYIRFATNDEINENMPLEINPRPDTIIRILMTFKGLENPIDVQEQQLETPNRTGFVAVEWGGTEIK